MKKPFYILALSLSILAISCSSNRTIGVLFDRTSCFTPYYVTMDIPIHHTPHWVVGAWINTFEYRDGSYFYYAPSDKTPNYTRIRSAISDSLWNQRFGYGIYEYQFNPPGDSLFAITYEDIDSSGLCWKDVHYLISDSLCVKTITDNRMKVTKEKGGRCRVTIGYARVPQHEKKRYDKALESFRLIIIRDSDSVYQRLLDTSFSEFARFRYLSDPQNVIYDDTTKINMYYERKRK